MQSRPPRALRNILFIRPLERDAPRHFRRCSLDVGNPRQAAPPEKRNDRLGTTIQSVRVFSRSDALLLGQLEERHDSPVVSDSAESRSLADAERLAYDAIEFRSYQPYEVRGNARHVSLVGCAS